MNSRFYVDTCVYGGYYDEEFLPWSEDFFNQVIRNKSKIVYSDLVLEELENAPDKVKDVLFNLVPEEIKEFILTDEKVNILAESYRKTGILSKKCEADSQHIALASINCVDYIVSWNFKHMVNAPKIEDYNKINLSHGYKTIDIRSPRELISYNK